MNATTDSRLAGLNWVDRWVAPLEGPMTIALKAIAANAGPARRTLRCLLKNPFETSTGLGLVGLVMGRRLVNHEVGALIVSRSVAQLLPNLVDLATQTSLRVCPRCLDEGALPYFLQFPVFSCCPVHDVPLLDACPSCGWKTSAYHLAPIDLEVALTCKGCKRPFSEAWSNASYRLDWDPQRHDSRAQQRVHATLLNLNSCFRLLDWGRTRPWYSDIDARDIQVSVMACAAHESGHRVVIPPADDARSLALRTCAQGSHWELREDRSSPARATEVHAVTRGIHRMIERVHRKARADSCRFDAAHDSPHGLDSNEFMRLKWAEGLARELWTIRMRHIAKDIQREMPFVAMLSWHSVEGETSIRPHFDSTLPLTIREWRKLAQWTLQCYGEAARRLYRPIHGPGGDCPSWLGYARCNQARVRGLLSGNNMGAFSLVSGRGGETHLVLAQAAQREAPPAETRGSEGACAASPTVAESK